MCSQRRLRRSHSLPRTERFDRGAGLAEYARRSIGRATNVIQARRSRTGEIRRSGWAGRAGRACRRGERPASVQVRTSRKTGRARRAARRAASKRLRTRRRRFAAPARKGGSRSGPHRLPWEAGAAKRPTVPPGSRGTSGPRRARVRGGQRSWSRSGRGPSAADAARPSRCPFDRTRVKRSAEAEAGIESSLRSSRRRRDTRRAWTPQTRRYPTRRKTSRRLGNSSDTSGDERVRVRTRARRRPEPIAARSSSDRKSPHDRASATGTLN